MVQATNWSVPLSGPATPTTMATRTDDSLDALLTTQQGPSEPPYKQTGTLWLDDSATPWQLKIYDGSAWLVLAKVNATSDVVESAGALGSVVDSVYAEYTANADLTAAIPADNTVPQVGEGTQILSASLTPKSTTNKLRVRFLGNATANGGAWVQAAAFLNGAANAIASSAVWTTAISIPVALGFEYEFTPGSLSAQTITVRVGPNSGTMRMNGNMTGSVHGGTQRSVLVVEEIKA